MGISHQTCQRFGTTGLGSAGFHQHHRCSSIVNARSIASGHSAVFFDEHWLELGQLFHGATRAEVLVCFVGHFAFACFEHDGHDLVFEVTGLRRALCAVVAFNGQLVLVFAGNAPLSCNVLGRHAHVDGVEGVVQCTQHHVDHFGIAHARTKAIGVDGIRYAAHVFSAATNGHICVTQQNGLAGRDDGLQA